MILNFLKSIFNKEAIKTLFLSNFKTQLNFHRRKHCFQPFITIRMHPNVTNSVNVMHSAKLPFFQPIWWFGSQNLIRTSSFAKTLVLNAWNQLRSPRDKRMKRVFVCFYKRKNIKRKEWLMMRKMTGNTSNQLIKFQEERTKIQMEKRRWVG